MKDSITACEKGEAFGMPQEAVEALWDTKRVDDLSCGNIEDIDGKESIALCEEILRRVTELESAVACIGFGEVA